VLSFSIVTPSLNQGRFIERTIRSVIEQGYTRLEHAVYDGGSRDETPTVLDRFADRLTIVREPDRGQADAVNKGIRSTDGDVIGWLNSDDVYYPGALASVNELLSARPDVDVVYGGAHLVDATDRVLGAYYTEPWCPERLVERCFLCQPAVFFRRRVVERFGDLDERLHYCMDYEYWLRLAAGGAVFEYLPAILAGSRLHEQTKTFSARLPLHQEINSMLRERIGRVPDSWLINQAHTLVELDRSARRVIALPYALDVVVRCLQLSWRWNGKISGELAITLLRPLVEGVVRRAPLSSAGHRTA
jgi:glycosyltransferase involved in cell wall biosynthesis